MQQPSTTMKPRLHPLLTFLIIFTILPGCSQPQTPHTTTRLVMGTLVTITTWNVPEAQERQGVADAFREMQRIDRLMSSHHPQSLLSTLNRAEENSTIALDPELALVIRRGVEIHQITAGAFDPELRALIRLWNFSGDQPATTPPDPQQLASVLKTQKKRKRNRLINQNPPAMSVGTGGANLDLGAIAKGYAIDRAITVLQQAGITDALVNAGGDLRILGSKGEAPWRIGIQHPRRDGEVIAVSEIRSDLAMVTSGDYERAFVHNDRRYHHILDPETGTPSDSGLISVSVQAPDAMTADALSTAFFVLGEKRSLTLLPDFPDVELLLVRSDGSLHRTAGFIATLRP
ncbi:MAG: FAD:protein FMN transferase [Magnetococcales bacterium]|nr:FAD:protein FMN transferase [Magnetococcales bacterium]